MKLKNLSISGKLFLILGLFAAAFLTSGGIIFWTRWQIERTNLHLLRHCYPVMNACAEAALELAVVRSEFYRYLGQYEPSPYRVKEALLRAQKHLEWMRQEALRPDRKAALSRVLAQVQQFQEGLGQLVRAQERGEVVQVGELTNRLLEIGASSYQAAKKLKTELGEQLRADFLSMSDRFSLSLWYAALIALGSFGLGLGLIFLIIRDLRGGIGLLLSGLKVFTQEHRVPFSAVEREDELGGIAAEFHQMASSLLTKEAGLRRAKEEWEATFDAVSDLVAVIDREYRIVRVNRAMADRLGVEPQDLIGRPCHEVMHHTGNPPAICPLAQMFRDGKKHCVEIQEPVLGGNFLVTVSPLYDRAGHLVYGVHVVHDITERLQIEAERLRLEKLEAVGVLAGGIAHDFNNILTAILGNLGLAALEPQLPAGTRSRLGEAEKACEQAKALAYRLLTFAKGGAPVKKPLDLAALLGESASLALSGSRARPVWALAPDLWRVQGDPDQLHQVLSNLLINADQAMPMGGMITIAAENLMVGQDSGLPLPPGPYVKVSVSDEGVGIAPEYLEKIFDPYFTTKQRGSGLGLATAYAIVQRHGGHLLASSELGAGATFTFYLPATAEEMARQPEAAPELIDGQGRRILIMDDDDAVRQTLRLMLVKLGFEVLVASDGEEALAQYRESLTNGRPFAAVILDLTIRGGLGGKETMTQLLALNPEVKAIVSSGYADVPVMSKFQRYGFHGVLTKPFKITDLSRTLREVLEGQES